MKTKLSPEIQAAIDSLYAGEPLGKVIPKLQEINRQAIVRSYRAGLPSRACAELHGVSFSRVCEIVKLRAPESLRASGARGWTKNLNAAKAEGRAE